MVDEVAEHPSKDRPAALAEWFDRLGVLTKWAGGVLFSTSIPFAGGGLAMLASVRLGLWPSTAFVAGYFLSAPLGAFLAQSSHMIEWRMKRAMRLKGLGILTDKEYEIFRQRITARYRK